MSLWDDYRDEAMASDPKPRRKKVNQMSMKVSRSFEVRYGGKFCVLCGYDMDPGDIGVFVDEELAHESCVEEKQAESVYIPEYVFDPDEH